MIGKGLFHTHLVVRDIDKSVRFYSGLFGMEQIEFKDGTLVFLTTPGRNDLLALNPGGQWGYPGGCAERAAARGKTGGHPRRGGALGLHVAESRRRRESNRVGHRVRGKLVVRCDHGGMFAHTYLADPDGYVCGIQYGQ